MIPAGVPPSTALASAPPGSPLGRYGALLTALAWCVLLAWLWIGAPAAGRTLGLGWALLGAVWPAGYFGSLALAWPWFGIQPGPSSVYLLEMGLMGLVVPFYLRRALGLTPPRRDGLAPWLTLLVVYSWACVMAQWRWIDAELEFTRLGFLFANLRHFTNSPTYGMQAALKLTLAVALYQMVRDEPWPARRLKWFWGLALGSAALTAVLGLLNYPGLPHPLPLDWWRGENPDALRWGRPRLQSIFGHPGWLAEYLALLTPAAVALGWTGGTRVWRAAGWGLALLLALAQLLTMARAGWLALAAGCAVVALLAALRPEARSRRWLGRSLLTGAGLMAVLALLVGGLALFNPAFQTRLGELTAYRHRTDLWQVAIEMIRSQPLTGVGLGNYFHTHLTYFSSPDHPFYHHLDKATAHNLYLHVGAEQGLIGLLLLLGVLAGGMARAVKAVMRPSAAAGALPPAHRLALAGGLTAFAVNGLFQYMFYVRTVELIFWIMLSMTAWGGVAVARAGRPAVWRRRVLLGLLVILPACVVWEHSWMLTRWRIGFEGHNLLVGGERVWLEVPREGTRFRLWLGSAHPDLDVAPQTLTVRYSDAVVAQAQFHAAGVQEVTVHLPASRDPWRRLEVVASRIWVPMSYGQRDPPIRRIGVLYEPLEALDAPPGG